MGVKRGFDIPTRTGGRVTGVGIVVGHKAGARSGFVQVADEIGKIRCVRPAHLKSHYPASSAAVPRLLLKACHFDDETSKEGAQRIASGDDNHCQTPSVECMLPQDPVRGGRDQMSADVIRVADG
jgi:hypothetical protein